ncbi:MAG: hypothetical protein JRD94_02745 [Deltaproteobacteria bacterium]|nr:hypothetical protein [Deltaproteobacteria bacterium]
MSARDFLHAAFHDSRTHAYRVVESTVWTLIILSIGVLVAEPFFSDGSRGDQILQQIDRVVLWLFRPSYRSSRSPRWGGFAPKCPPGFDSRSPR